MTGSPTGAAVLVASSMVVGGMLVGGGAAAAAPASIGPQAGVTVVARAPGAGAGANPKVSYPVPAGAIVVSPKGSDTARGSAAAPLRTLRRAIAVAHSGSTIVMRAGWYAESVVVPADRRLTIQNWPGEVVWLDGSKQLAGWKSDGGDWRYDGWTAQFDRSHTFVQGAADSTTPAWRWVSAAHPAAAWPEQVWLDRKPLIQVTTRAQVTPGTFYVDLAGNHLYVGSNPVGHNVRASVLTKGLSIRSAGTTVRGIGVRKYATSVPLMGAVTVEAPNVTLENVRVSQNATSGIHLRRANAVLRDVNVAGNGLVGITSNSADNLRVERSIVRRNNREYFNMAPVSGGIKAGRTRGVTISNSVFADNVGPGVWMDESTTDMRIVGNVISDNAGHGISVEISARALIAGNSIHSNGRAGGFGIKINDTSHVRVWNNTILGGSRPLNIVQDARRYSPGATGWDPRIRDSSMTWVIGPVEVRNNVIGLGSQCLLCVEDYSHKLTAEQLRVTAQGNVYQRTGAKSPSWFALWSRGSVNRNPYVLTSFPQYRSTTRQDSSGHASDVRGTYTSDRGVLTAATRSFDPSAVALPGDIATQLGVSSGLRRVGPMR